MTKNLFPLLLITVVMAAKAASEPPVAVVLESTIAGSAARGDVVRLVKADGKCRYLGELIREPAHTQSLAVKMMETVGGDAASWHIAVERSDCQGTISSVKYRIELPIAPALAGGGGIPPSPYGYQAGTRFEMLGH